jgi:SOS-response transcriptional repressor LexA
MATTVQPTQSTAIAAYAQEALVRSQERNRERRSQEESTTTATEPSRGDRVTLSDKARRLAQQAGEVKNGQTVAQQTGDPQAVIRKQLEQNDEARLGAAKSAMQAINAYRGNAVSKLVGG